ncbi:hypothetical protein V5P93_005205 [Actinokineospora auranticolor]|uniref:CDP-glycerol:poly(Glycerophosphate) glycerophosphotransferase n=1 Tax=Actinokineospora auranticolor TaxID=155976 RepID=A0A2S6GC77_9PSEU|nr:hypothetical protein [Actinokineospora auranticolor]PPK62036.1 hypothetical protein CLV40_1376 [Actinokineospora auranticolor]
MTRQRVPIGIDADRWVTVAPQRVVLVVAHNIATLSRLLDVIDLFDSDFRVQLLATTCGTDPFNDGLPEAITALGLKTIPWDQALSTRFDLVLTASPHGGVPDLHGPKVLLSHGVGYTKRAPGARGADQVFGLTAQWLLDNGEPIADALVLAHDNDVARLRTAVPQAAHTAVLAGDPCLDRMRASRDLRNHYRARLGVAPDQVLVVVSTTWSTRSLLGSWPEFYRSLLAELPVDRFRTAAIIHPNATRGHGPRQIRTWLADCARAGLVLIPDLTGWQAALVAADCVIGDNGAVTCYAAALGHPVLLAAFPEDVVAQGSAVHALGLSAPRLVPGHPLLAQVEAALARGHDSHPSVRRLVSSIPDESPDRLRSLFYRVLDLPEPQPEPVVHPVPLTGIDLTESRVSAWNAATHVTGRAVKVSRYPADARTTLTADHQHLAVHARHPGRRLRGHADVLFLYDSELDEDLDVALSEFLARYPGCALAAVLSRTSATVRSREGETVTLTSNADAGLCASVAAAWLFSGAKLSELTPSVRAHVGARDYDISATS